MELETNSYHETNYMQDGFIINKDTGSEEVILIPYNKENILVNEDNIKADLDIKPVRWIDEVLDIVLTRQPIPWEKEEVSDKVSSKKSRSKKSSVKAH